MGVSQIYDNGQTFAASVLDIEESQLLKAFSSAITAIASVSLAVNYPTLPSVIHSVVNSYKKVLSVAIETDYDWEEITELKDRIANPDKYASSAPAAASGGGGGAAEEAKVEEKKEEEDEESGDDDMGFGLFGDDDE
jgi:large subunit ribosomal protein LP0